MWSYGVTWECGVEWRSGVGGGPELRRRSGVGVEEWRSGGVEEWRSGGVEECDRVQSVTESGV